MSEAAIIKTSEGEMVLEFWPDVAPGHVENFIKLAKKGFYDGTCFHRVIKGFMIQTGDPLGDGTGTTIYVMTTLGSRSCCFCLDMILNVGK